MNQFKVRIFVFKSSRLSDWSCREVIRTICAESYEAISDAVETLYPNAARWELIA